MRLATFMHRGRTLAGVIVDGSVLPLPEGPTVLDLVRLGLPEALAVAADLSRGAEAVPVADVRLLAPLEPPTIRDFVAFEEHVEGVVRSVGEGATVADEWYQAPTFYFTNPYAVIGAHDDVPIPPACTLLDFELEVAAVIGREGRDLTPATAADHIFGYTVLNDWSARDLQRREMRVNLGPCKGKDFATTLGPWLVTADELTDRHDDEGFLPLAMTVAVNGVEIGRDLLSNMGWPFADLVAYAARGASVRPGDVLGSGTCGNGGCLAELWGRNGTVTPPPLRSGDVVTMDVEGIGRISNRVVPGPSPVDIPPARRRPRLRPAGGSP